ncbi:MAG: EAL domain-containing protein [Zoogloea sp.]|uniref:putative bifunctional diguanylate cyclase/phosphodiesterase n=1 Tax=Zoogloea sp. TaxID=49181 RepID=UPI0026218536|nr:EAL domain-containing protein [Zoogloea sp.]MDD3326327.1 EAL domain-containing protein [Zoogloea sp.]
MLEAHLADARILVVDDTPANVELLLGILEDAGYRNLLGITDPRDVSAEIARCLPDLILLDIRMPHLSGFDVLRQVRWRLGVMAPPVIVLTAQTDQETRSQSLELGAIDFLNKPFDQGEVQKRIRNILLAHLQSRDLRGQTELLQSLVDRQTAELRSLALTDSATGLPNRRAVLAKVDRLLGIARQVAVFFIVADEVEEIARVQGYPTAERLLQALGELAAASPVAQGGIVGCWGSSELVLVQPADGGALDRTARRLLRLLEGDHPVDDLLLATSIRIGIAHSSDQISGAEDLLRKAAAAIPLQPGEPVGRFSPGLEQALAQRGRLRRALKQAVPGGELALVYQPKIDLASGRLIGAEALLRWHSTDMGAVRPDIFIPLAEASGDILAIGDWVLDAGIRQVQAWHEAGQIGGGFALAINVSSRQLLHDGFVDGVLRRLAAAGLPPGRIKVEVTESGFIHDLPEAQARLGALREAGIGVSIDDFGTGYSSLSYLKSLPVSELKIDRSFMREIEHNVEDQKLVETIIMIAHVFGCSVVAEGIESQAQLDALRRLGCDQGQGYLFSKPLERDAFEALIRGAGE